MDTPITGELFVRAGFFLVPRKHRELFAWPVRSATFDTVDAKTFRAFLEKLALVQWARSGFYGLVAVALLYARYRLRLPEYWDAPLYFVLFWAPCFMAVLTIVWLLLRHATRLGPHTARVIRLSPWIASAAAAVVALCVAAISMA